MEKNGIQWKKLCIDELILNQYQMDMNCVLMTKVVHMNEFTYFSYVIKGSAGKLALIVVKGL